VTFVCGSRDCIRPDDEEWHSQCAAASADHDCYPPTKTHQHILRRSRGGRRCDVMLCWNVHNAVDNGEKIPFAGKIRRIKNDTAERWGEAGMTRIYRIIDRDTHEVLLWEPLAAPAEAAPARLRQ